jgi:kynurenine formamidase
MKSRRAAPLALFAALALFTLTLPGHALPTGKAPPAPAAQGDPPETPIGPRWWPSEWGPKDQRGAANRLTPARVLEAAKLIRTGKVYQLGRLYEHGMPLPGNRHFSLTIPGSPTGGPSGKNRMVYHDEMFSGEIGQVGTQLDGLGHVGVRMGDDDYFYNGFRRSEFGKAYGLLKLGIENVGVFFTRGVLIDVARFRGVEQMKIGDVITVKDLEGALNKQGVRLSEGCVVLLRTGHGRLWMKNNELYGRGEPGLGMAAARWLCARKIVLVGADTWATEVVPHEDKDRPFEVHQLLLVRHGIYNLENLDLEELARDRAYEFAFVFAPLRLKGATGSPGNPVAVR